MRFVKLPLGVELALGSCLLQFFVTFSSTGTSKGATMKESREFWEAMKASNAVWEHSGDPKAPHVRLRNGRCTDGFIDTLQYLSTVVNLVFAAKAMADKLIARLGNQQVDWVFGSPMAGIPFATLVGVKMGILRVGFTEKDGNVADNKSQICRFDVGPGETFLRVEEMTTSGETPERVKDAIIKKNPETTSVPFVGALLIRCERRPATLNGSELVPLIDLPELGVVYNEWEQAVCPLCASGSRLITNTKKVWFDLLHTMKDPKRAVHGAVYANHEV